ncbi:hypothetical protein GGF42_005729 [Coemansia sp. RSA 2424]|nr:hypothetical protein GGF42_005729 [Coemansia sp. RSA 2424]
MTYNTQGWDMVVYTDGACLDNGKSWASGGVGVYFGANDFRNYSGPLMGSMQTNQRAELDAIRQALLLASDSTRSYSHRPSVLICSDSQYSINCVTQWYKKWHRNGWLNSAGRPVVNCDLIQDILVLIQTGGCSVQFQHVPGHSNIAGNVAAHNLASAGARS